VKKIILTLLPIAMLTGCCIENPLLPPSVELHNSAHKDLMNKYIPNDPSLSPEDKQLRLDALKSYGELLDTLKGE
jgi:hypothetical protein